MGLGLRVYKFRFPGNIIIPRIVAPNRHLPEMLHDPVDTDMSEFPSY